MPIFILLFSIFRYQPIPILYMLTSHISCCGSNKLPIFILIPKTFHKLALSTPNFKAKQAYLVEPMNCIIGFSSSEVKPTTIPTLIHNCANIVLIIPVGRYYPTSII